MRILRTVAAAAALVCASAPVAVAAPVHSLPGCAPADLRYASRSLPPIAGSVVLITVTNRSGRDCTVDRFPTVTFTGLDGSANPMPPMQSGPHVIGAGARQYAALRTDAAGEPARYVPSLAVAANPAHDGVVFTASEIGAPAPGIAVYDPITSLWQDTVDDAVAALPN